MAQNCCPSHCIEFRIICAGSIRSCRPPGAGAVGAQLFGPAPAPIARIRGRHRVRLLVKADKGTPLQPALRAWIAQFAPKGDTRLSVDIDPQSFY